MAKQLNVDLSFKADTSQAKSQIQSLIKDLEKLSSPKSGLASNGLPLTKEILEAQSAAKQLQTSLESAFNASTGKLDLSAFNSSLQKSGMSLQDYSSKLTMLGKDGDKAFLQVAQSIVNTQTPLRKTNALVSEFATTLKNTAKWQISSSILHGFMGAVQSAYGYAQDLNESLNNIRIVTGQNIDQMTAFAAKANDAAKALSTTTTQYTNASLIYYQQGLDDSQVQERTDITVKLANVTGQSAETVSDQMTAIWNNFDDGSKSLEYYADVLTALGASTASSTDEIAQGLEKFAAVSETVGLSYEYATAALATVTAETRQSADVVGTAFKTIFARIQGLELGQTLEDGVDLNKYSEALQKVGVDVLDATGGLKDADVILQEMAGSWDTLTKAQQVALAQAVGGVRQYNQIISLMDNWDVMEQNLATAGDSSGTLSEQADIYAESWEASKARVQASLEGIYQSLIDDKFFISLNDGIADTINLIKSFIDSIGGAKGALLLIGSIVTRVFSGEISKGINNAIDNLKIFSGAANKEIAKTQQVAKDIAMNMTKDMSSKEIDAMRQSLETTYTAQEQLRNSAKSMSVDQLATAQTALQIAESYNQIAIEAGRAADEAQRAYEQKLQEASLTSGQAGVDKLNGLASMATEDTGSNFIRDAQEFIAAAKEMEVETTGVEAALQEYYNVLKNNGGEEAKKTAIENILKAMNGTIKEAENSGKKFEEFKQKLAGSAEAAARARSKFDEMKNSLDNGTFKGTIGDLKKFAQELKDAGFDVSQFEANLEGLDPSNLKDAFKGVTFSVEDFNKAILKTATGQQGAEGELKGITSTMRELAVSAGDSAQKNLSAENAINRAGQAAAEAQTKIKNVGLAYQSIGSALTGGLQGISSFAMGLTSLKSAFDTLKNPDLGTFEKFTSVLMSLSMGIPGIISSFTTFGNVIKFVTSSQQEGLAAQLAYKLGLDAEAMGTAYLVVSKEGEVLARHTTADAAKAEAAEKAGSTVVTEIDTAKTWANIAAKMAQHWYILVIVAALAALAAALYVAIAAYNEEANAAKKAAEAVKELDESQKELEEKANNLKSSWDAYDTAVKKLEECTKGTKEWEAALKDVNDAALDVLDNLPDDMSAEEIKSLYNTDKGYMELDADKVAEYQKKYDKSADIAQYAKSTGDVSATQAKVVSDSLAAVRDLIATQNMYAANGMTNADDEYVFSLDEDAINNTILENFDEWTNLTESEFQSKLEALGVDISLLSNETLTNFQAKVEELGATSEAANEKLRLIAKIQVEEQLGDEYDDTTKAVSAEKLADRTQELQDAYLDLYTSNEGEKIDFGNGKTVTSTGINKASGQDNAIYQQTIEDLKEAGYDYSQNTNGVQGTDDNRYFTYLDEDGEVVKRTAEWVAETVAASKALAELEGIAENAAEALANMENIVGEEMASGIKQMITNGDLNNLTAGQLENMKTELDSDESGEVSSDEAVDYLRSAFEGYSDDEIATMFGKDSIEEAGQMWADVIQGTTDKWGDVGEGFVTTVQNALNGMDLSDLNMNQATELGNILQQAFIVGGSEGMTAVQEMFKSASAEGFGDEFIDAIGDLDWESVTPKELSSRLQEAGVTTQFTEEQLQIFIDTMASGATTAADASAKFKTLNDIIKDIKVGDTIDAQSYEDLGPGMEDYFLKMADGTYQLIGDAEEFYNTVHEQSLEGFKDNIKNAQDENATINNVLNTGVENLGEAGTYGEDGNLTSEGVSQTSAQLDFLSTQGYDPAQIQQWREELQAGTTDVNAITAAVNEKITALGGASSATEALNGQIEENNTVLAENQEMLASSATSMDELNQFLGEGSIDMKTYEKAIEAVGRAEAKSHGLDPDKFEDLSEMIEKSGDSIKGLSKDLKGNEREANDVAKAILRYDKAVASVTENYDDWMNALESGNLQDQAEVMDDVRTAYGDMLDIDADVLSDDFVTNADNLKLMQDAANGSEEAYDSLMLAMQNDIIAQCDLDKTAFDAAKADLDVALNELDFKNLEIGADLNTDDALNAMTDLVNAAGMTADQATSYLASMGIDAEVETQTETVEETVGTEVVAHPTTVSQPYTAPAAAGAAEQQQLTATFPQVTYETKPIKETKETGATALKVTSANKSSGGNFKHKNSSSGSGNRSGGGKGGGGGGGGGGGSSKPAEPTKKTDIVDRYKELDDQLDDVRRTSDQLSNSLENLYGPAKEKAINQLIAKEKEEKSLLEEKQRQAEKYREEDKKALNAAAKDVDVKFTYDKEGNIKNYTEQMEGLYSRLHKMESDAGSEWDENEQKQIEDFKKKIDKLKEAQEEYEKTKELLQDIGKELDELAGKNPMPVITSELLDVYKEANDELDDIEEKIKKISDEADGLYGKDKINRLKEMAKLEKDKLATIQKQIDANKKDVTDKQQAVDEMAKRNGLDFDYDENGNITNYEDQMKIMTDKYERFYAKYAKDGKISEAEQTALDALLKDIEDMQSYVEQYTDAVEEGEDLETAKREAELQAMDYAAEALNLELEYKVSLNDKSMRMIEYKLGKMEDDVYSMAEALQIMTEEKTQTLLDAATAYQDQYTALQEAFANGEITEEAYMEGLEEVQSGLLDTAEALAELDDEVIAYYGETLAAAQEEIEKYTSHMDHLNSVLEHYATIVDLSTLTKKSTEYFDNMDTVLQGQLKTAQHSIDVAKKSMDMFKNELADKKKLYDDALAAGDEELIKIYQAQYESALEAANNAEEEYLSRVEDYANKVNEILDHTLEKLAVKLEDSLTGGTSFDAMNTGMERMLSLHEEYLTTTNKVYETTKLMNKAQQEIDKTSNTVTKNKMKSFIQETQNLQNQNKLSKFELDIQQAKYDLLVAEIALEEAKDAKSQVRLQRDSEGNFGYVYTADQQAIQNAEQQYLDAQNKLYNTGLEGANNYVQKYQQTMNEMYDTLTNLADQYRNGEFASEEEYQAAVEEAKQYYYEKLDQFSYLHYQAIQTDDRVATDYILSNSNLARTSITGDSLSVGETWRKTFLDISGFGEDAKNALTGQSWQANEAAKSAGDDWKIAMEGYISDTYSAFTTWKENMAEYVNPVIGDLGTKTGDVVTKSQELRDTLCNEGGVIDQLQAEITEVNNLTTAYIALRGEILAAIKAAETTAQTILDEQKDQTEEETCPKCKKAKSKCICGKGGEAKCPKCGKVKSKCTCKDDKGEAKCPKCGKVKSKCTCKEKEEKAKKIAKEATEIIEKVHYGKLGNSRDGWIPAAQKAGYMKESIDLALKAFNDSKAGSGYDYNYKQALKIVGLDTGGYTGEWGSYGKLAMLHEKELVLNKNDTANLLSSVEVLQEILQLIDLQSANALTAQNLSSPTFGEIGGDTLEQNVHIEASFPNATDKNEIEEAFKELVNLASQYTNRK